MNTTFRDLKVIRGNVPFTLTFGVRLIGFFHKNI